MTETKVYIETKEECQSKIDAAGAVCSGCGGILSPIETVDNFGRPTFWMGCETCEVVDYGVSKIKFEIARRLVEKHNFVPYGHMDNPDSRKDEGYKDYWLRTQTRGAKYVVSDVLRIHKELTEVK